MIGYSPIPDSTVFMGHIKQPSPCDLYGNKKISYKFFVPRWSFSRWFVTLFDLNKKSMFVNSISLRSYQKQYNGVRAHLKQNNYTPIMRIS